MAEILFATAPDGTRLPVIDITNPAFAAPESDAEIAALSAAALAESRRGGPVGRLVMRLLLRAMAPQSRLIAALQGARRGFLGGIPTYVMKLGPANAVPPYDSEIDRRVMASAPVTSMRIRLFGVARLLADALAPALREDPEAPLVLLEIAGGPSADGLNALILLAAEGLLASRRVRITIYDLDAEGPALAESLLAALRTGPLRGLDVAADHVSGNWADTAALGRALAAIPPDAVVAAASEGGLFEYGTDAEITGALETLAPRVPVVVGSVTRDDALTRAMRRSGGAAATRPRGLERFGALIAPTGYRIARSRPSPLSDQVLLTRS